MYILHCSYTISQMINKVSGYKCPVIRDNSVHQRKSMIEGEGDIEGKTL